MIAKMLGGYCRGYDTPGILAHRLVSLLGSPASRSPATAAHLSHVGPGPHPKTSGQPRPLPSPSAARFVAPHDLSSIWTLGRTEGGRAVPSTPALTHSARTEEISILSARTGAIPTQFCIDKTTLPGRDDRYGIPPPKYGPTRRAYDPTHYRMGHKTMPLTFKADQATKDINPAARDRGHWHHD
jgi:hypothetical protein